MSLAELVYAIAFSTYMVGVALAFRSPDGRLPAEVMGAGIRDFRAAPRYGLFFGGLYAAAGWLLVALVWKLGLPFLAYPLAMGFALIAPTSILAPPWAVPRAHTIPPLWLKRAFAVFLAITSFRMFWKLFT